MNVLDAQGQKKQAIHRPVSPGRDTAVRGPHNYDAAVKDKTPPETGGDESQVSPSVRENNPEERNPNESPGTTIGLPGQLHAEGAPAAFLSAGYHGLPAGNKASGNPSHDQVKKDANTVDGKAIRKAIEKALVYPLLAKKRGLEGTALTEFKVNAKGYPEYIRVIESSGYNILDSAAKESLIRAAPFSVGKGRYEIPITFRLKIN
jgi:protein TonB